jgi:hypothetical protein
MISSANTRRKIDESRREIRLRVRQDSGRRPS